MIAIIFGLTIIAPLGYARSKVKKLHFLLAYAIISLFLIRLIATGLLWYVILLF